MPPKPTPAKAKGTLNSKHPNPYEIAYKTVWDMLPAWKRNALTDDIAAKNYTSRVYEEFTAEVVRVAEGMYDIIEKKS